VTARPASPAPKQRSDAVRLVAKNRKAFHEYFVEEKAEAGLELTGTEVKSLREGRANLTDGWVEFAAGQAWLHGVHVSPYLAGSWMNPDPVRKRRLLLHKREILKWAAKVQRTGSTCVPLSLYFKGPRAKVEIALVTGKKLHDKRETIKRREADRESRAAIKAGRTR
jgi:SsrA-binding protein